MLRLLVVILAVQGLVPGLGEIVETVVHRVTTGHFAHAANDPHDKGGDATEHGCGVIAHHCGCCVSLPITLADRGEVLAVGGNTPSLPSVDLDAPRAPLLSGLFRPPIA